MTRISECFILTNDIEDDMQKILKIIEATGGKVIDYCCTVENIFFSYKGVDRQMDHVYLTYEDHYSERQVLYVDFDVEDRETYYKATENQFLILINLKHKMLNDFK